MEINLDLIQLFKQIGVPESAFNPQFAAVTGNKDNGTRIDYGAIAQSPYYLALANGKEVYLPVEMQVGFDTIPGTNTTYAEALGVKDSSGAFTGRWQLPYPVFSVESRAHVIDTELTERNGMVSELINFSGYKLNVKGFLIGVGNEFPEADFTTLIKMNEMGIPIRINNPITDVLFLKSENSGANTVTLRNFRMPEKTGVKHVRYYELELMQDVPFNLIDIS